jgi:glycosyltransferase involved in cell wall biosynthesis
MLLLLALLPWLLENCRLKIVNIVNSFIGRKGNIGLRTSYIIKKLNEKKISSISYSRGIENLPSQSNINMGILGHIPRLLNAYRIYIDKNFNSRRLDIKLFEFFFLKSYQEIKEGKKICHVWESSPKIIKFLKEKGFTTILDMPIAPTKYAIKTFKYYNEKVSIDYSFNIEQEEKSFDLVDYIISPSSFVTNELIDLKVNKDKIFTVPFGVDITICNKKIFTKNYEDKGVDYCFAGAVNKRKGIEFLLEAWNDEKFKNDRLHLCGRLYPEIKKLLKKYNFKNVILPGFVETDEYFKKCDVYVFPSLLEGSSKSIYEAMGSSLPCIVSYNSGSIIVDNQDGFLIDIGDKDAIRDRMLSFKLDTSLIEIMGNKAFDNVQKYSWDYYAENVIDIYKKID